MLKSTAYIPVMDLKNWEQQLEEVSGNLATNAVMPKWVRNTLLEEDATAVGRILLEKVIFHQLESPVVNSIEGLNILAGLQDKAKKTHLTLFRAIRFPTYKRMSHLVREGFTISNYEQERILELYKDENYIKQRQKNQSDERFWVQPQERVVHGIPVFSLVNDALQIHRAFRGKEDKVALAVIQIPRALIEIEAIRLIANAAIDLDYQNSDRDVPIKDFREKNGIFEIDYPAMRARGVDVHEMYSQDIPRNRIEADNLGIEQEFYLLDIYQIEDFSSLTILEADAKLLKKYRSFLHGLFGDQNIFGRRKVKYLPYACYRISKK